VLNTCTYISQIGHILGFNVGYVLGNIAARFGKKSPKMATFGVVATQIELWLLQS
jgi:hypothetical protein